MRISHYFCLIIIVLLASSCIYQANKKENIYIYFEDLKGYESQFIDSTDILKTRKVLINHAKESRSEYIWEINIDTANIKKTETNIFQQQIINSQFFIINNFKYFVDNKNLLSYRKDKYRIFILKEERKILYILPVKEVNFLINNW